MNKYESKEQRSYRIRNFPTFEDPEGSVPHSWDYCAEFEECCNNYFLSFKINCNYFAPSMLNLPSRLSPL